MESDIPYEILIPYEVPVPVPVHDPDLLAELDRLRAELAAALKQRDEARRDACAFEAINQFQTAHPNGIMSGCAVVRISREIAVERGWDCYATEGGGADGK